MLSSSASKDTNAFCNLSCQTQNEELLKNGTVIITAKTRDELAEMVNDIPADVKYGAGAVGMNPETGVFSLRLVIINP